MVNENYTYQTSDQPENTVLSQTPGADSKLKENGVVALTLSKGPEKKTYSVALNSNGGGSVTSDVSSVEEGGQVTIYITPDDGYEVASARGLDDVPSNGGTFTLQNVKDNVSVTVTFQKTAPEPTTPTTPGGNNQGTTPSATS